MTLKERTESFAELGAFLSRALPVTGQDSNTGNKDSVQFKELEDAVCQAGIENPWFIRDHVLFALKTIALSLDTNKIDRWLKEYDEKLKLKCENRNIGVVMAGNLPLVGFHDFVCALIAGDRFYGKLSSDDSVLLPAISTILLRINPGFKNRISFTKERLAGFDAIIATGSNNTYRYFDYYFGKYPNILRKSRNGVAILTGKESTEELTGLADDIFLYFGKGCRSVSKVYLPEDYDMNLLKIPFQKYQSFLYHNKYMNNYDYYKAIFQVGSITFHDFDFLLLKEEKGIASPISVLHYEYYKDNDSITNTMKEVSNEIQCVINREKLSDRYILPGNSQRTELWDYADGIDTMDFLLNL